MTFRIIFPGQYQNQRYVGPSDTWKSTPLINYYIPDPYDLWVDFVSGIRLHIVTVLTCYYFENGWGENFKGYLSNLVKQQMDHDHNMWLLTWRISNWILFIIQLYILFLLEPCIENKETSYKMVPITSWWRITIAKYISFWDKLWMISRISLLEFRLYY